MAHGVTKIRARDEEGFTLLEVLITLALLSVAFVAILSAVAAMIGSGAQNKSASTAEAAVRNVAEFVREQPYVACSPSPGPAAAYQSLIDHAPTGTFPAGYATQITKVEAWNASTTAGFALCPGATDTDVQRVTVRVSSPAGGLGGQFTRTLTVVKRAA